MDGIFSFLSTPEEKQKLQQLLSTSPPQEIALPPTTLAPSPPSSPSHSQQYIQTLSQETTQLSPFEIYALEPNKTSPGYTVRDNFLGHSQAQRVYDEILTLRHENKFKEAGMGRGDHYWRENYTRGDYIMWLSKKNVDQNPIPTGVQELIDRLECLIHDLAKKVPEFRLTGLTSTQCAIYPGDGAHYVKHLDTFTDRKSNERRQIRKITCIYFLNPKWKPQNGGQLRVFSPETMDSSNRDTSWDIAPLLDRLVVFRSEEIEHEVLPTFNERMAITTWFYGFSEAKTERRPETKQSMIKTVLAETQEEHPFKEKFNQKVEDLPKLPIKESISDEVDETIFVSIPSYRDQECQYTVQNIFKAACKPGRVYVGICWQYDPLSDSKCFQIQVPAELEGNVRVMHVRRQNASGPCWARAMAHSLYREEKYHLQIDSHMRFRNGWDAYLIDQLKQCPSSKPILTTYPRGYIRPNLVDGDIRPTLLCAGDFDADQLLRLRSKTIAGKVNSPLPSRFYAAGFCFSLGNAIHEVPYDPSLKHLFFGEEISMAVRLWTHGYNFYAPTESVVYHLWSRSYRPIFRENSTNLSTKLQATSLRRVRNQLTEVANLKDDTYGLGCVRSLVEYESFCGVKFSELEIAPSTTSGGRSKIDSEHEES